MAEDYTAESLEWYEEQAEPVADFAAFFLGYIIGRNEAAGLTERDWMLGEMLLPGFMHEDLGRIADAAQGHAPRRP
jgi:hypothetical protein